MLRSLIFGAGLLLAGVAVAAPPPANPVALPLFEKICLSGELSRPAREAALTADGWTSANPAMLEFDKLGVVKSLSPISDFKKPQDVKLWIKTVDGTPMRAVVASYEPKRSRYSTSCALLVPGVKSGMAYFDGFKQLMKSVGLKGRSNDLPHYTEFSGKLADGRPARGDLFSRSQVAPGERDTMHLYIAF